MWRASARNMFRLQASEMGLIYIFTCMHTCIHAWEKGLLWGGRNELWRWRASARNMLRLQASEMGLIYIRVNVKGSADALFVPFKIMISHTQTTDKKNIFSRLKVKETAQKFDPICIPVYTCMYDSDHISPDWTCTNQINLKTFIHRILKFSSESFTRADTPTYCHSHDNWGSVSGFSTVFQE